MGLKVLAKSEVKVGEGVGGSQSKGNALRELDKVRSLPVKKLRT